MSEEPFDHIDDRIRKAAEESEPQFDPAAWQAMELLLDKDKRKRRPFAWWWAVVPLLLISGAGYLSFNNKSVDKTYAVSIPNEQKIIEPQSALSKVPENNNAERATVSIDKIDARKEKQPVDKSLLTITGTRKSKLIVQGNVDAATANAVSRNDDPVDGKKVKRNSYHNGSKGKLSVRVGSADAVDADDSIDVADKKYIQSEKTLQDDLAVTTTSQTDLKTNQDSSVSTIKDSLNDSKNVVVKEPASDKKDKKKGQSPKLSKFYFLLAGGFDAAGLKFLSLKNTTVSPRYGVAVGYQLSKKLGVQAGFYAGRKKYLADAADYKTKPGSYWDMVQLQKVDASCLVYEIPISVRYNFIQKNKTTFFATAGLTSYIMKKEDYKYFYTRYSMPYESQYSYTGNKNLFSVFTLSAGIEQKISQHFSIFGEPYFGVPLSGVGDGTVKIFSTGLQVGLKFQPGKK